MQMIIGLLLVFSVASQSFATSGAKPDRTPAYARGGEIPVYCAFVTEIEPWKMGFFSVSFDPYHQQNDEDGQILYSPVVGDREFVRLSLAAVKRAKREKRRVCLPSRREDQRQIWYVQ